MRQISASEFKAKCLALLDNVQDTGEPIEILKRGRPVARLIRSTPAGTKYPQDSLKGTVKILGDIIAPATPAEVSDAASR